MLSFFKSEFRCSAFQYLNQKVPWEEYPFQIQIFKYLWKRWLTWFKKRHTFHSNQADELLFCFLSIYTLWKKIFLKEQNANGTHTMWNSAPLITNAALRVPCRLSRYMFNEFAVHFPPLFATGSIGCDESITSQVQHCRKQSWKEKKRKS